MSTNLPKEKHVSVLYGELYRLLQTEEYERILKQCNKILGLAAKEVKAFHCKVVCLIQLDKIDECMNAIVKNPDLSKELYFERAYCEYRQNDPEKAMKTIEKAPELTAGLMELKAQVLYKLDKFEESYKLYRDIVKKALDDYDNERQTNISALLSFIPSPAGQSAPVATTYEILYNKAFKQICAENYVEAEKTLASCEKLCLSSCEEEGYSDEETEQELAFIRLQLAYCYQKQGRIKQAQQMYSNILRIKTDDANIIAIASNNLAAINKDQNLFDSKKKIKLAIQEFNKRITTPQAKSVYLNNCLLLFYLNQTDNCLKACDKVEEMWPADKSIVTVIRAFVLFKDGKTNEAIEILNNMSEKDHKNKLFLQLAGVQILLNSDRLKEASDVLNQLGDDKYRPGVVGLRVSIFVALGDQPSAAKVFEETVDWYKKHQEAKGDVGLMWQQAVDFHMKHGNQKVAASCLEELLRTNPKNKRIVAKLIIAYVQHDQKKAEQYSKQLPSLDELTKDVKEEEVEICTSGWKARTKAEMSPSTPRVDTGDKPRQRTRKKKKNKTPLPDGVYLDPERWLPRYERSGYKRKRDRRAKDQIKGSQGTASHTSEPFDFSGKTVEKEVEMESPEPSRLASKRQPQKKKKSRSRK